MLFVVTVVFMGTPFGPNRYPFWFESDRERAFSGLLPVYGAAFIHDLHDPPSPPLSFRSFFRFLSVREVLESPFYGYFFYPFWYGVEPRLHVCCLISSCECFTTSTSLALACGLAVFLGWRSVLVWFVCSGFLVGIRAPFGRNRSVKGLFSSSSRCMDRFSYVDWDTPPSPLIFLGACFHSPFRGRGRFSGFPVNFF